MIKNILALLILCAFTSCATSPRTITVQNCKRIRENGVKTNKSVCELIEQSDPQVVGGHRL